MEIHTDLSPGIKLLKVENQPVFLLIIHFLILKLVSGYDIWFMYIKCIQIILDIQNTYL
jgi:hypothetical protein